MNQLQRLNMALIAYVNSAKAIWSAIAYPLSIPSKLKRNVKDYKIYGNTVYGKNLLDVKKYYGEWANDSGGISIPSSGILYSISSFFINVKVGFKENTQYTFSCKYNIAETTTTTLSAQMKYTDGTRSYVGFGLGYCMGEGTASFTSTAGKTVASFSFTYGTASKVFKGELTEMMIVEGTDTDYEPCNPQHTGDIVTEGDNVGKYHLPVRVRGKNIFDMSKATVTVGYYLDGNGGSSSNSTRLIKISPMSVEPSTTYTISSNLYFYTVWFFNDSTAISEITAYGVKKKTFTTPENCTRIRVSLDLSASNQTSEGVSAFKWAMIEKGTGDGIYEPYIEPQTTDIYLDAPLDVDKVIQKSVDGLPSLPQFKGTTIYEVQTEVPPSGMEVEYYE